MSGSAGDVADDATFTITSDPGIAAIFHARRFSDDGRLDAYTVALEGLDFRASTDVDHPIYGTSPLVWFADLAASWRGWSGTKNWRALEDELGLAATCDRTGHVTIVVSIPAHSGAGYWAAQGYVRIDAGQLERLAGQARRFFANREA